LQLLLDVTKSSNDRSDIWAKQANSLLGAFRGMGESVGVDKIDEAEAWVKERKDEGPFGTADFNDSITTFHLPRLSMSNITNSSSERIGVRVGIVSPVRQGAYYDVRPDWGDRDVRAARRGNVIIDLAQ
jgi:hypothetical protein